MRKTKKEEDIKTKGEALCEFVLRRYNYSKTNMADRHDAWHEYYEDYRGTQQAGKEDWQANYIVTSLKESIRTKIPIYMNILFSAGLKSFDIKPGEETDEDAIPVLKDIIMYQLDNVAKKKGGFFNQCEGHIKQFELYSYSLAKVPWKKEKDEKGKLIFEGIDIEVWDIFNAFPDPGTLDIGESWIVLRKRDVFVSYLRMLEKQGTYHSILDLKDTSQSDDTTVASGESKLKDDRVELLEYHGEVPKSLLEGDIQDEAVVNPYEDDYVKAIITVANREVCIRNEKYPYDYNIFCDASKDKMPNEQFGVGTGEDIQSYASELTNAHNKLADCVNLIANPMAVINPQKMAGLSGGIIISHPGKMFATNPNVDDVSRAMMWLNTTAQAAALRPLIEFIRMLEEKIQKTSEAVPVIAPSPTKEGLPETLGATKIMQANAAEPLKHIVKHCLEPWFQKVLEIIYKHDIQFFSKASAYRVLGKEKAQRWLEDKERKEIKKEDIKLSGNPDFIPRGVSVFEEQREMIANLLKFLEISPAILEPQYDPMGNVQLDGEGKPAMTPAINMKEIAKRVGENMKFPELEDLIPGLKKEREAKEAKARTGKDTKAGTPTPATPSPKAGMGTPPTKPALMGTPKGGNINQRRL